MSVERIALVTGANQGVGLQVAKELAANGVTVLRRVAQFRARRGRGQRRSAATRARSSST